MTIIEAQGTLLNFFLENDHFDPREDFNSVIAKDSITRDLDRGIIIAALEYLEEKDVVCSVVLNTKDEPVVWVLIQPLNMRTQNVDLSFPVASAVVNTINNFSTVQGGSPVVDIFTLNEGSIAALLSIIQHLTTPQPQPEQDNGES